MVYFNQNNLVYVPTKGSNYTPSNYNLIYGSSKDLDLSILPPNATLPQFFGSRGENLFRAPSPYPNGVEVILVSLQRGSSRSPPLLLWLRTGV